MGTAFGPVWHPVPCTEISRESRPECRLLGALGAAGLVASGDFIRVVVNDPDTPHAHHRHPLPVLSEPWQALGSLCCSAASPDTLLRWPFRLPTARPPPGVRRLEPGTVIGRRDTHFLDEASKTFCERPIFSERPGSFMCWDRILLRGSPGRAPRCSLVPFTPACIRWREVSQPSSIPPSCSMIPVSLTSLPRPSWCRWGVKTSRERNVAGAAPASAPACLRPPPWRRPSALSLLPITPGPWRFWANGGPFPKPLSFLSSSPTSGRFSRLRT